MLECIVVGIGGFIGAVCRYLIGLISVKERGIFPIKTFLINLAGSFLIGAIAALTMKNSSLNPKTVLFFKVGICGGFTTFSSFALETSNLLRNGNAAVAFAYSVLSVIFGVVAVFAGEALVK